MSNLRHFDKGTVVSWTKRFVETPSEQSPMFERDPAVLAFISKELQPLIEQCEIDSELDGFGNLRMVFGPAEAEIQLAIFAYAMTHPRSAMSNPFHAELIDRPEGPAIRGRGVSEQKAAMAASLAAAIDVAKTEATSTRCVWFGLTAGETGRHDAMASALAALGEKPKYAVLAVGTGGRISLGNRGRLDIEVTIRGRPAHSSTPWLGVDVVPALSDVLRKAAEAGQSLPSHTNLGPASLVCTSIRTWPESTHTVQSKAHLVFDRRLLPGEDPDEVFAHLQRAVSSTGEPNISVAKGALMFGCEIAREGAFVETIQKAMRAGGLQPASYFYSDGALDAGYLQSRGIEAIMWGPGETAQFHTDDESVLVGDLLDMTVRYRALLKYFATSAGQ